MSVIVITKKENNKGFYIAADSQITTHNQRKVITPGCKIFNPDNNQDIVVGIVGSLRDANLISVLEDLLDYSAIRRESLTLSSIVNHTVKVIQDKLKEQGRILVDQGQWLWDSAIVIATKDKAFMIDSDFCVQEVEDFASIGAPSEYVYGAKEYEDMFSVKKVSKKDLTINLIKMVINLTTTVDYPIVLIDTETNKKEVINNGN